MKSPFPKKVYEKNAEVYKIMAHPKRLEILNLLKLQSFSVSELVEIMKVPKANISQHLALLRAIGLVKTQRNGLQVIYSIVDPRIVEPCRILKDLLGSVHATGVRNSGLGR